ncbi:hypothetical protein MKX03_017490 [Papaver bracteatum]|nr:hypothetical protein MKX03_017490 [Papaver bracteatum]
MLGLSLSFHRNLSHGSFKIPKPLEYLFAYFGLHAAQVRRPDVLGKHSSVPPPVGKPNNVMDLRKQAYYRFLQKTYLLHLFGLALLLYVVGGLPHLIWGMSVRLVYAGHATFLVGSVGHTWGERPWNTKDLSTNNWVLAIIVFGEGWHNNHHAFEYSARVGLEWWQVDVVWYVIKLLEYVGLATNVKVPTEIQKRKYNAK